MTLDLTPEQERRIQALVQSGAYDSANDVVDAALVAFEQLAAPAFEGADGELEKLLLEGLDSPELSNASAQPATRAGVVRDTEDEEFWRSVDRMTDAMLAEHKPAPVRESSCAFTTQRTPARLF